jgi:hypothetical protein
VVKNLLLTFLLILSSCSKHEDHETVNPYDDVKARDASYRSQLMYYSLEELFPDRCDRLTFYALYSAFVTRQDLSGYEWNEGEWHRDVRACYPDDSKSEISFDPIISLLHDSWTHKDFDRIDRLYTYGTDNGDVFGSGPRDLTYLPQVRIIINDMRSNMLVSQFRLDGTHNEHLLALSAWLKLRYANFLESHDLLILENLRSNPLIEALLVRVEDGDQHKAIEYLRGFPEELPLETGIEGWGSAPSWLYWFLIYGVVSGK